MGKSSDSEGAVGAVRCHEDDLATASTVSTEISSLASIFKKDFSQHMRTTINPIRNGNVVPCNWSYRNKIIWIRDDSWWVALTGSKAKNGAYVITLAPAHRPLACSDNGLDTAVDAWVCASRWRRSAGRRLRLSSRVVLVASSSKSRTLARRRRSRRGPK